MVFSGNLLLKSGDLQMYLRVEVNARQAFKWDFFFFLIWLKCLGNFFPPEVMPFKLRHISAVVQA